MSFEVEVKLCDRNDDCLAVKKVRVRNWTKFNRFFKRLLKEKTFSETDDKNGVWVMKKKASHFTYVYSYYTRTQKLLGDPFATMRELCSLSREFVFIYYESPLDWKKEIESMYGQDTYSMWKDGWLEDYKYCDEVGNEE